MGGEGRFMIGRDMGWFGIGGDGLGYVGMDGIGGDGRDS